MIGEMLALRTGAVVSLLLLSGCAAGPAYRPPEMAIPANYSPEPAPAALASDIGSWWSAFNDPVLDDLIGRSLKDNPELGKAVSRVAQARAQERVTRASGGLSLNAGAQAGYTKLSENSLPAALGSLGGGSPSDGSGLGLPGEGFPTYQAGFDASWEIDWFGGRRRGNEAAHARTEAAVWSRRDAEVTLAAEVANHYQQYRALRRRVALMDETLGSQRELLDFIKVRSAQGLTTTLDERRQQRDLDRVAAEREDLVAQAEANIHALGILLGLAPAALEQELSSQPATPQPIMDIPPGLPSELLQRRPDIRAAERQLAAATADIGVAAADLYPKISLTGVIQLASRSLSTLLESDSLFANGAGRVSWPLIGRGASRANVELRRARADEALLTYQGEVLGALRDVEDALTRLDADRKRADLLRAAERAARDAADTVEVRYRNGLAAQPEVLEARQTLLSARDGTAQAEASATRDVVALYKALGGGWDERRAQTNGEGGRGRDN